MRAMLKTLFSPNQPQLSAVELRLLKQAERVLQSEDDELSSSPCISVCRMSEKTGLCEGCFRTLEEITGWGHRAPEAKKDVWRLIAQRLQARTQA
jgi:predicted Fe-S protein YdhL (DUF1289 family)